MSSGHVLQVGTYSMVELRLFVVVQEHLARTAPSMQLTLSTV
jgi:hypothetical protein